MQFIHTTVLYNHLTTEMISTLFQFTLTMYSQTLTVYHQRPYDTHCTNLIKRPSIKSQKRFSVNGKQVLPAQKAPSTANNKMDDGRLKNMFTLVITFFNV